MIIIKFKGQECWIAPWDGDPGRTLVKENAKIFTTVESANKFIEKTINKYQRRNFDLEVVIEDK